MKKIFLIVFAFAVPFLIVSCEEDEQVLPSDDFFVAFEGSFASVAKTSEGVNIPVYVAAERGQEVTVNIGIESENTDAVEGTDFEFLHGPTLSYPIGAGYDTLRIAPMADGNEGDLTLELFLDSNSAGYKMGFFYGEEADSTSHNRFTVVFTE